MYSAFLVSALLSLICQPQAPPTSNLAVADGMTYWYCEESIVYADKDMFATALGVKACCLHSTECYSEHAGLL